MLAQDSVQQTCILTLFKATAYYILLSQKKNLALFHVM